MLRVAQIGIGRWGKNIFRNLLEMDIAKLIQLKAVSDSSEILLTELKKLHPSIEFGLDPNFLLANPEIDAVLISTPASTHFELAQTALKNNKHVFIEKPMVLSLDHLEQLTQLAKEKNRTLMEGHLLLYHPAVIAMRAEIQSGRIGKLIQLFFRRTNLGAIRYHENAMWDFAPHDFSVMHFLADQKPVWGQSIGASIYQPGIEETVYTSVGFESGLLVHLHESWLSPFKERQIVAVGNEGMLVMDELANDGKLKWVKKKVVQKNGVFEYVDLGWEALPLENSEPLKNECQHFIDCISQNKTPRSGPEESKLVLETLLKIQESIQNEGKRLFF